MCVMNKMEKLLTGCTFFIVGTIVYGLSALTNDEGMIRLVGIGLPIMGLLLMYLGIKDTEENTK